jgi:hypothetical protein
MDIGRVVAGLTTDAEEWRGTPQGDDLASALRALNAWTAFGKTRWTLKWEGSWYVYGDAGYPIGAALDPLHAVLMALDTLDADLMARRRAYMAAEIAKDYRPGVYNGD